MKNATIKMKLFVLMMLALAALTAPFNVRTLGS